MRFRYNLLLITWCACCQITTEVQASTPPGFVKTTISLDAPPVGLAFDQLGKLYALEQPAFGSNQAMLRVFNVDGSPAGSFPVLGADPSNFFVGGMTYDPIADQLLVTDNTADGELYAVSKMGARETIAGNLAGVADVAVRNTGEIFVSTSPFGSAGAVLQVDRTSGSSTVALGSLGYGAGLAFDANSNLIVQDADTSTFAGRLQRLPMTTTGSSLTIGSPQPILSGMTSSAGVAEVGNDLYTTGAGGLYYIGGSPTTETLFDTKGTSSQFATAIAFAAGPQPFQAFGGPAGGRLAYMADFGFGSEDSFVTLLTPAEPGDYNGDGLVNASDYTVWRGAFGTNDMWADGNRDGIVDAADYVIWRAHSVAASSSLPGSGEVPEPSPLLVGVNLLISIAGRYRLPRRHKHAQVE
ncbi:MAG TPA: hypothetical protein VH107_13890 [Lacipirellulaceae bacterium]|nr:hypothetical protein [Lacipirellulaceae bacterium]